MKFDAHFVPALTLLLFITGCGGGGGSSNETGGNGGPSSADFGPHFQTTIISQQTHNLEPIYIRVPPGYAASQESYPVIYALDGDDRFATLAKVLDTLHANVILVAIGGDSRRDVNYQWPGAKTFYDFITLELIPMIDAQYRTRHDRRALEGHSLGGLFVGLALFMDRLGGRYFTDFIPQDGSFFIQEQLWSLEQQVYDSSNGELPVNMVLSGAVCCNYQPSSDFYNRLLRRNYRNFHAQLLPAYQLGHVEMLAPSFKDSVVILFPDSIGRSS